MTIQRKNNKIETENVSKKYQVFNLIEKILNIIFLNFEITKVRHGKVKKMVCKSTKISAKSKKPLKIFELIRSETEIKNQQDFYKS